MCSDPSDAATSSSGEALPPPSVLQHIVDVHCHPTDTITPPEVLSALPIRICAMATRQSDQRLVAELATTHPDKVTPCFGYHPWFAHWIALTPASSKRAHYASLFLEDPPKPEYLTAFEHLLPLLPEPIPLADVLASLRADLAAFPHAILGEVGIDRAFRIPYIPPAAPPYPAEQCAGDSPSPSAKLSPFATPFTHQLALLEAQLAVAVALQRNVSVHSVKCQQATVDLLRRMRAAHGDAWARISVDLHSCGLSAQTWRDIQKVHSNVFLSLSTAINARSPAHRELIAACAPDRILVESDFHDVRFATEYTVRMLRTVAEVKGWAVEDAWEECPDDKEQWGAVRRLEANWRRFEKGGHTPIRKRDRRKLLLEDWESDEEDRVP